MQEYTITAPDGSTYTAQLDEDEAKRIGAKPVATKARTASNKSRSASTKKK